MRARDLMTPAPGVVTLGDPLTRAAEIMRDRDVGVVPVVDSREGMRVRGVVTEHGIVVRYVAAGHQHGCLVAHVMTPGPPDTVPQDAGVREVIRRMEREGACRVLVTDEEDRLVGIITEADLLRREGVRALSAVDGGGEGVAEPLGTR